MASAPLFRPEPLRLKLVVVGPPRTKKTGQRIVKVGKFSKILPSKAYLDWERSAILHLTPHLAKLRDTLPLECAVNCSATFYRDADRGDACNYYQALADMLQKAGVIRNDVQIEQWDGSRLSKSDTYPRIEVLLEEIR
jgi:Holliday junction resolvase RusA-like endonuclease